VIFSPLSELRSAFLSQSENEDIVFNPRRTLNVVARPTIIRFTANETRLIISLDNGQISVYDTSYLFIAGSNHVLPVHSWPSRPPVVPQQILPNPGDMPDLVAILFDPASSPAVIILDVQSFENVGGWTREDSQDPIMSCALFYVYCICFG
jgi:nucleoporin NUP159